MPSYFPLLIIPNGLKPDIWFNDATILCVHSLRFYWHFNTHFLVQYNRLWAYLYSSSQQMVHFNMSTIWDNAFFLATAAPYASCPSRIDSLTATQTRSWDHLSLLWPTISNAIYWTTTETPHHLHQTITKIRKPFHSHLSWPLHWLRSSN